MDNIQKARTFIIGNIPLSEAFGPYPVCTTIQSILSHQCDSQYFSNHIITESHSLCDRIHSILWLQKNTAMKD
jgi:hypothetical protein